MGNEVQTTQNHRRINFIMGLVLLMAFAVSGWIIFVANMEVAAVDESNASEIILTRHDSTYSITALSDGSLIAVGRFGRIFRSPGDHIAWKEITSPTNEDLYSVAFVDDHNGVAVGASGTYLETVDGGHTWNNRTETESDSVSEDQESGKKDQAWVEIDSPITEQIYDDSSQDQDLMSIVLEPDGKGIITGSFGLLWRTDSGGNNWEPINIPWEEILADVWKSYGSVEAHLYDAVVINSNVWVVGEYGLVLLSTDGGRTFEKRRGGQFTDNHLFAVVADPADPSHAFAVGQAGLIIATSDNGLTWRESSNWETDLYDILLYEGGSVVSGDLGTVLHLPTSANPDEYNVVAAAGWKDVVPLGDSWIVDMQHLGQGHFLALGKQSFRDFSLPSQLTNNVGR